MIRLIVCDVDGTLLDENKQLDRHICQTVQALREKKILFTIATGRNEAIIKDNVDLLEIDIPYACDNGANLYLRHALLESRTLNKQEAAEIIRELTGLGVPFTFFDHQRGYSFSSSAKLEKIRALFRSHLPLQSLDLTADFSQHEIYKLTLDAADFPDMEKLAEKISRRCPHVVFKRSEDTLYTVTAEGTSKGQAMNTIARLLKIDLADVLSIGDNYNDISMFELSGLSAAMGNSHLEVKSRAETVIKSNENSGVSDYLIRTFLKPQKEEF